VQKSKIELTWLVRPSRKRENAKNKGAHLLFEAIEELQDQITTFTKTIPDEKLMRFTSLELLDRVADTGPRFFKATLRRKKANATKSIYNDCRRHF
jgi:hypothetical protein